MDVEATASRILFMDDEELVQRIAARTLQRLGYQVDVADDGVGALALFAEARRNGHPFAAVILDMMVPGGMGGTEVLGRLRSLDPSIRAIASSGYDEDWLGDALHGQGFAAFLAKPYHPVTLAETLDSVLSG